ncbi:MAG: hypothetical protein AB7F89_19580, partial [Pirellulaceae bacterium]
VAATAAIANIVLVCITSGYARSTEKISKANRDLVDQMKQDRDRRTRALYRSLYFEVYTRLARLSRDAVTWGTAVRRDRRFTRAELVKFRPVPPVIFPSLSVELGSIDNAAMGDLALFYHWLGAVIMDIDRHAETVPPDVSAESPRALHGHPVEHIAAYFAEASRSGLSALNALRAHVPDHAAIDAEMARSHAVFLRKFATLDDMLAAIHRTEEQV